MKVARQLLIPALLWLSILAVALLGFAYFNNVNTSAQMESEQLSRLETTLRSRLETSKDFALALAVEVANDPEVQKAFAEQDRTRLVELTLPAYQELDRMYSIPQAQFHLPPATSFLRLHAQDRFGDDLSAFRFTVLAANEQKQPIAGLEIGRGGLGMRGVVPVSYQGQHIGTFEYGFDVGQKFLESIKTEFGVDAQILLRRSPAEIATIEQSISSSKGPTEDWLLQASTLADPLFAPAENYLSTLGNHSSVALLRQGQSRLSILTIPLSDYSGQVIGAVELINDRSAAVQALNRRLGLTLVILSAMLILGGIGFSHLVRRAMRPITALTEIASAVAAGDLNQNVQVSAGQGNNEFGLLAQAFNSMTTQLRALVGNLERRVNERTTELERRTLQLQTAAEVTRDTLAVRDLDKLLDHVVNLVRQRFGFYHAGIFFVDKDREYAVLRAATGEAGREMLARSHRLKIGESSGAGAVGIVGYVTGTGKARIALDVGEDAVHFMNPLLPRTRSELALPLVVGGEIIGALDVQSTEPAAFSEQDVEILQILADQTAVAIANARLFTQNQAALEAARQAYTELSQLAWQERLQSTSLGYQANGFGVQPLGELVEAPASQAEAQLPELQLPIVVRDQVIGSIAAHKRTMSGDWSEQELILMQKLADELSQALESARLFEETQERALRERLVGEITSRIRSTLDIETVLHTAAREMQQVLKLAEVELRLGVPAEGSAAPSGSNGFHAAQSHDPQGQNLQEQMT